MEQFFPERNSQDIKFDMLRMCEIDFSKESEHETPSNVSLPEMYNAAKGRRHKKKTGKFGTMSQIGGGVRKKTKKSQIQIRTFETDGGGGLKVLILR